MTRAGVLLRLLRWTAVRHPNLLDATVVQQVEALAAADDINPAVQVRQEEIRTNEACAAAAHSTGQHIQDHSSCKRPNPADSM